MLIPKFVELAARVAWEIKRFCYMKTIINAKSQPFSYTRVRESVSFTRLQNSQNRLGYCHDRPIGTTLKVSVLR
jgi:hypothetical protein